MDGERYCARPRATARERARQGAARRDRRDLPGARDIELVNFKVRILDETKGTGAVTRVLIDASDGHDVWGSIGVSENVIGASWDALVDSLEYGLQRRRPLTAAGRPAPQRARVRDASRRGTIPLARPVLGEPEERAVLEVLRSGQLSLGPRVRGVRAGLRRARRRAARERRQQRHRRAAPGAARRRGRRRRRGRSRARSRSWPPPTSLIYERARPVFADIDPRHAEPRPAGRRGGRHRAHARAAAGAHLRLPRRHAGVRADRRPARPGDRRGRLRGARRAARRRDAGRRARAPGGVRLLRQQAAHHRRGRDGHARRRGA